MTTTADPTAFAFQAQSPAGEALSGTIDAASVDDAARRLRGMQLRVIELSPLRQSAQPRPLRGVDFQAFNTQLAHLAAAGLPVEQSLRLIADDMHSPRRAEAVRQIAQEMEAGQSLPEALQKHAAQFPPLYSQLVGAGIRTGNLPGMLLNLGRHLDLVTRLRAVLWGAIAYPLMLLISLIGVIVLLGIFVLPQFRHIYGDFHTELPMSTNVVLTGSQFLLAEWPVLLAIALIMIVGWPILWRLSSGRTRQKTLELLVFPLPLIGPALRRNLLARWCDALKLGIQAGLDLPAAIDLAGDAVASPGMQRDGQKLIDAINAGQSIDTAVRTPLIPPSVVSVIALASNQNDLPAALETLSQMFRQQAEIRMSMIPAVLTPLLIILIAMTIGFVVLAMFAPMICLFSVVSGSAHK
jgi:type IV pilus assembly protein PilC